MIARLAILLLTAPLLAGCLHTLGGSVAGIECKFLERPPYAVRGATPYDQDWIDPTIEGAIGACEWQRPAPRPAAIDAQPARALVAVKKRGAIARISDRLKSAWPRAHVAPVLTVPDPPAPIAPPPKPRRLIDELLHPSERS